MDTSGLPVASCEYVVVDVETNGRSGEACELTEVAGVLVGAGELHERFVSLVRVEYPLSRGIQRFTGIRQDMVDSAPPPDEVLPRLESMLRGRALVAHSAGFDRRVLRQAFERCGLEWPDPPSLCTVAMARRFAPLVRRRGLGPLAEALGIEVEETHRALVDALTCARVFCALFPKLCANAHTVADAVALLSPRRRAGRRPRRDSAGGRVDRPLREERPDLSSLPDDPGVYVFRDERGRPLYVGKSVSLRSRARSHFCAPADWTGRAETVDYRPTCSELGALVLENRLIKRWQPPGNVRLRRSDGYVYLRCRFDVEYPVLEVGSEPASGRAVSIGPVRGRGAALELAGQLNSLFLLRHCGRRLQRREHPSAYGQMGRCLSPCIGDLDPNLYRRQLDSALSLFSGPGDAAQRLLGRIEEQMSEAAEARRYERAATLRHRRERIAALLARLDGVLEAAHSRSRLVLARHPCKPRWDAFWIVRGRVADWGPLPAPAELAERTLSCAARETGRRGADTVAPEEVDELRLVSAWLARHDPPQLELSGPLDAGDVERWLSEARPATEAA